MTTPNRRSRLSWLANLMLSLAVVLVPASAWAQSKPAKKEPTPEELKGYTLPYFFTGIAVLAVACTICWAANRKWDVSLVEEAE